MNLPEDTTEKDLNEGRLMVRYLKKLMVRKQLYYAATELRKLECKFEDELVYLAQREILKKDLIREINEQNGNDIK